MKNGSGGEEREAPTHLIEISELTHAVQIDMTARYVAKKVNGEAS